MGRPKKPIQRRSNGIYCVQIWLDGKRHVKSLETRDPERAAARAAQAIRELQKEASSGFNRWDEHPAEKPLTEWPGPIPYKVDGRPDVESIEAVPDRETTWGEFCEDPEIQITPPHQTDWLDLVREAESVRKRKHKKPYSASWHKNVGIAIKQCPFTLQQASPTTIRDWIKLMEKDRLSGLTIANKCTLLSGLVDTCIKSGLLAGQSNPFGLVDYAAGEADHIPPAEEQDYRGLKELLPTLDIRFQLPILIQAYCGTRISEVLKRQAEDFDLSKGTMEVAVGTAKNKASERTIPLPPQIVEMLKGFDFAWGSQATINKWLKTVNSEVTSHSFRHGLTKLARDEHADQIGLEAMLGHVLSHSHMANMYGGKYGHEAMRKAVEPVWRQLDEWMKL